MQFLFPMKFILHISYFSVKSRNIILKYSFFQIMDLKHLQDQLWMMIHHVVLDPKNLIGESEEKPNLVYVVVVQIQILQENLKMKFIQKYVPIITLWGKFYKRPFIFSYKCTKKCHGLPIQIIWKIMCWFHEKIITLFFLFQTSYGRTRRSWNWW